MNSLRQPLLIAAVLLALVPRGFAQGSAFTYQGRLSAGGMPANGQYEITFTVYNALTNGTVVGTGQTVAPIGVTNGLFTTQLDFGAAVFDGSARWLEITVTLFGSDMIPTTLTPRQPITPTPYAIHAANAAGLMTFNNAPLDIKVNGQRALRLEPTSFYNPQIVGAPNVIGGSSANIVTFEATGSTIGGGGASSFNGTDVRNLVESSFATIGGGMSNSISTQASGAVVGGGMRNTIRSEGVHSTIGGGFLNIIQEDAGTATISGGRENNVTGDAGTIGGGWGNTAAAYGTVGGGYVNSAASHAAVGGGFDNSAIGSFATVGGGQANTSLGDYSAVGGGEQNRASGEHAFIGAGEENEADGLNAVVGGGFGNSAEGTNSTVGGGWSNQAHGYAATVPGGALNFASGGGSFAAGSGARATHTGAFVWSDGDGASVQSFPSTATNEFSVRARGGVRFVTAMDTNGSNTAGVSLAPGSGTWSSLSDRNAKENLQATHSREILEKVAALPLATWNYKSQDKSIRHLGPMAQDFRAAFGLGENDRTITTVDADGVVLAAIQGLNQKVEQENRALRAALGSRDVEITELKKGLAELREMFGKR